MGLSEVSEMVGMSKQNVRTYLERGQFPQPVKVLASGPLWLRVQIQMWLDTPRPRGRRRKEN
ncbi:helix-turn-helix transcriptional regulator [Brevibacillus sp. HD3.3A]|uniref:helix-turn-helix transcriptional regulator n=1 Tax=Brevibacillus sp. HD3.3A TaxID=2738979 RepID=UPI00351D4571|nr:AlpA family phage regulatory protein [Brevibacillus sp. HD3.3A]